MTEAGACRQISNCEIDCAFAGMLVGIGRNACGWRNRPNGLVIPDLVSEQRERRVSGIHAVTLQT
jgi:hypothetical protein